MTIIILQDLRCKLLNNNGSWVLIMKDKLKKEKLELLLEQNYRQERYYYQCLYEIGDLKQDYFKYLETTPMDASKELKRLENADYDLCAALLTMLLREDHWINGSFEQRYKDGEIRPIIQRMIDLL